MHPSEQRGYTIRTPFCVQTKSLMCKDAVNRDSTFRSDVKSEEIQVPCQPSGRSSHPVRTPLCPLFHPFGRRVIPSGRQTVQHHPSGRRAPFVRTPTLYREVYVPACTRPDVLAARSDAYQFSNGSLILSKFQEREDQSTVRTMWYPIRTRVSVRQEWQLKIDRPDVWQSWSGRWCIVYGNCRFDFNRLDVYPSWSGHMHIRYGNCVLKFSRPDAHPSWFGRAKPDMEITCSRRATVRTMCHPVRTRFLYRKDFSAKFLKNLVAQLSVRTANVHRPDGAQVYFTWRPFCTLAYKLRPLGTENCKNSKWIPLELREVFIPSEALSSVLLLCYN